MKIIDKYIIRSFLAPLFYVFAGFILIFVLWDLFDHLQDFIQNKTPVLDMLKYYLFLIPSVLIYVFPVSILLAVLYSLLQLTKHNELTAMRASGISLYRLVVPLILLGATFSISVLIINETIGPRALYWTQKYIDDLEHGSTTDAHVAHRVAMMNRKYHREWFIEGFHTETFEMEGIRLTQHREDGSEEYVILAKKGEWVDGFWWLSDLSVQKYDQWGNPMGAPKLEMMREMIDLTETPDDFINTTREPSVLSSLELLRYIETQNLSKDYRALYMTDLHRRLATPWTCLVVALLGIPFGTHTARKGALTGIVLCLLLFFSYYIFDNVGIALGKSGLIPSYVAGWSANALFLSIAAVMVFRMR